MKSLIKNLKENNQDFEFYPTTDEILKVVNNDIKNNVNSSISILDIGAGDGRLFRRFEEWQGVKIYQSYAIEKSRIHINNYDKDVIVMGCDFYQQSLIDKQLDVIFSNPPYSDFEEWTVKIIKEANCKYIYLVIPQRWKESDIIKQALEARGVEFKTIGNFDFLNADRQARAKVDLVKIDIVGYSWSEKRKPSKDPFELWFEEEFKFSDSKSSYARNCDLDKQRKQKIKNEIVKGDDLCKSLVEIYNQELTKLLNNYKKLTEIDHELFEELGVEINNVRKALESKIKGLKSFYWKELFNNFNKITDRLTSKYREKIFNHINSNFTIDFNLQNIYAIVLWVIKNANQYYDDQLQDFYLQLSDPENVRNYKSNQKVFEQDRWGYNKKDHDRYCLDYRIITTQYGQIAESWGYEGKLRGKLADFISDMVTISRNLGFQSDFKVGGYEYGKKETFHETIRSEDFVLFPEVKLKEFVSFRIYKNNNIHLKFNKDFMKALNIEAARLFKWVHHKEDILNEFPDSCKVSKNDIEKYFTKNSNNHLGLADNSNSVKLLALN